MNTSRKLMRLGSHMFGIALRNPKRLSHVMGTALAASAEVARPDLDLLRIPEVAVEELLPDKEAIRAQLVLFPRTNASISVLEFTCLILLMHKAGGRNIFEFGTYKGVSITQLALNLPEEGSRIYTLDLPEGQMESALPIPDPEDIEIAFQSGKGSLVPGDLKHRIQFLKADSAVFDESPYLEQMDFVFVDGAHNAEYVQNDSEKGWRMLTPGGIIAWHDCRIQDAAVLQYLIKSSFGVRRVQGTTLAFAQKPK